MIGKEMEYARQLASIARRFAMADVRVMKIDLDDGVEE